MINLVEFLLARIAEDEVDASDVHELDCDLVRQGVVDPTFGWACSCKRPARVLAECEARRLLVGEISATSEGTGVQLDHLLEAMALPYADHPEYRREWAPL